MLEERVKNITEGIKLRDKLNTVNDENIKLKSIVKKIADLNAIFLNDKIAKKAISIELEVREISEIKKISRSIAGKIDSKDYSNVGEDISKLSEIIRKIDNNLKVEWKMMVGRDTNAAVSSLNNIKELFDDKREIDSQIMRLKGFESRWPINLDIKENFKTEIFKSSDMISELNLTPEIELFIKKIIGKTATFNDLTDEVLTWIKDNNFEKKIKIGF